MKYYPINIDIAGKPCLVIGGGSVAERKVTTLIDAGARVKVVSPDLTEGLANMAGANEIEWEKREARADENFDGFMLAFVSTDDPVLNGKLASGASKAGALVNAVDAPAQCDFTIPSIIERGDIMLTISTAGKSPALSKKLRLKIEEHVGDEYRKLVELLGAVRGKIMECEPDSSKRGKILTALVASDLETKIKAGDLAGVDDVLLQICGDGYSLDDLGIKSILESK